MLRIFRDSSHRGSCVYLFNTNVYDADISVSAAIFTQVKRLRVFVGAENLICCLSEDCRLLGRTARHDEKILA